MCEKNLAAIFMTLGQGQTAVETLKTLNGPHSKVRATYPIAMKLDSQIPLVLILTWLNLEGIMFETFSVKCFFFLSLDLGFQGQILKQQYFRNGLQIVIKCVTWYWTQYDSKKAKKNFVLWTPKRQPRSCPYYELLGGGGGTFWSSLKNR